jgi:hypothetical protein
MDDTQVEHWKDLALRFICVGLGDITIARKVRLWIEAEAFIEGYRYEPIDGWDNAYCLCDVFRDHFSKYIEDIWDDRAGTQKENPRYFANQIEIALRASVGLACESNPTHIIGYTVGDLRAMYAGQIPEWITSQYEGMDAAEDATGVLL